jgi:hypothetical protein
VSKLPFAIILLAWTVAGVAACRVARDKPDGVCVAMGCLLGIPLAHAVIAFGGFYVARPCWCADFGSPWDVPGMMAERMGVFSLVEAVPTVAVLGLASALQARRRVDPSLVALVGGLAVTCLGAMSALAVVIAWSRAAGLPIAGSATELSARVVAASGGLWSLTAAGVVLVAIATALACQPWRAEVPGGTRVASLALGGAWLIALIVGNPAPATLRVLGPMIADASHRDPGMPTSGS